MAERSGTGDAALDEEHPVAPAAAPTFLVRDARAGDEQQWRALWQGYLDFYEESLSDRVTAVTWSRILDPASAVSARVAERDGRLIGFATSVLHPTTWTLAPACYLEDLFVDPAARGGGAGRALIADLLQRARSSGWARLYWHTRAGNPARRLYDEFVPADDYVKYSVELELE